MIKTFRYLTLLSGFIIMLFIMKENYSDARLDLSRVLILLLWIMFPFYLYFFITRKSESVLRVALPGAALIFICIIFTKEYFNSDNATKELVFLFIPVAGLTAIGAGFLVSYVSVFFRKN